MRTVTLKTDMRPWRAGDDIHVEDDLASQLVADGEAENMRPFPPGSGDHETAAMHPGKGKRGYKTKGN